MPPKKAKAEKVSRVFQPLVLRTKEDLLVALKRGDIKSAKYNVLSDIEKEFVEYIVFGDMTAAQAYKLIKPACRSYKAQANRMLANPDVADALTELSTQKEAKFAAELLSSRDKALQKLNYIMATTKDEVLAASVAKTIMEQGAKVMLNQNKKEESIDGININVVIANEQNEIVETFDPADEIIMPVEEERGEEIQDRLNLAEAVVNEETDLNYVLGFEEYIEEDKEKSTEV